MLFADRVDIFMGLPVAVAVLGTLTGVYTGRREHHTASSRVAFSKMVRKTGLFTAIMAWIETLAAGFLALNEG